MPQTLKETVAEEVREVVGVVEAVAVGAVVMVADLKASALGKGPVSLTAIMASLWKFIHRIISIKMSGATFPSMFETNSQLKDKSINVNVKHLLWLHIMVVNHTITVTMVTTRPLPLVLHLYLREISVLSLVNMIYLNMVCLLHHHLPLAMKFPAITVLHRVVQLWVDGMNRHHYVLEIPMSVR
jgi:hypothetical protein